MQTVEINILGISGTDIKDGNCDTLVKEALKGAEEIGEAVGGVETDFVTLADKEIVRCKHCQWCIENRAPCKVQDDFYLVYEKLIKNGYRVERLDGDTVRGLFPSTGFSKEERNNHIERVGHLASILERNGIIVVASFISPYEEARDFVRRLCQNFIEIYMATPVEVCEKRDTKDLYGRARRGEIKNLTGYDDPYEVPTHPELTIDASHESAEKSANRVLRYIQGRRLLS